MKPTSFKALSASLLILVIPACKQEKVSLDELRNKLDSVESEVVTLKRTATGLRNELERAKKEVAESTSSLESATKSSRDLLSQQETIAKDFANYRDEYRQSILKRAIGMDLGTLTIGASIFTHVQVKSLDAWELGFQHSGGIGHVALKDLPTNLQDLFAFNPDAGPKPEAIAVNRSLTVSAVPESNPEKTNSPNAVPVTAPTRPQVPGPTGVTDCTKAGDIITLSNGQTMEVLTRWGNGGGTKVKGATATVPQGYRPIGSSYSGTAMDKVHKDDKAKKH